MFCIIERSFYEVLSFFIFIYFIKNYSKNSNIVKYYYYLK